MSWQLQDDQSQHRALERLYSYHPDLVADAALQCSWVKLQPLTAALPASGLEHVSLTPALPTVGLETLSLTPALPLSGHERLSSQPPRLLPAQASEKLLCPTKRQPLSHAYTRQAHL